MVPHQHSVALSALHRPRVSPISSLNVQLTQILEQYLPFQRFNKLFRMAIRQEKVQFNSVPWPTRLSGGHDARFSKDSPPVFSAGKSSGMGRDVHSLMLCTQHFLCRPRRRPPSKVYRTFGFGEVVTTRDIPAPCEFPSLDSCQKRFLLAHKDANLAPHPVVGRLQTNLLYTPPKAERS